MGDLFRGEAMEHYSRRLFGKMLLGTPLYSCAVTTVIAGVVTFTVLRVLVLTLLTLLIGPNH